MKERPIFKLDYATPRPKLRRRGLLSPMLVTMVYCELGVVFLQWAAFVLRSLHSLEGFAAFVFLGVLSSAKFYLCWKALKEIGSNS